MLVSFMLSMPRQCRMQVLENRMIHMAIQAEDAEATVVESKRRVVLLASRTESILRCWFCNTKSGLAACGIVSAVVFVTSPGICARHLPAFT